jgi:hypothetical protein
MSARTDEPLREHHWITKVVGLCIGGIVYEAAIDEAIKSSVYQIAGRCLDGTVRVKSISVAPIQRPGRIREHDTVMDTWATVTVLISSRFPKR